MQRAYRFRFYPTAEQAVLLSKTFGCVRWVYNKALANREQLYRETGKGSTYNRDAQSLTGWKRETPWWVPPDGAPPDGALQHTPFGRGRATPLSSGPQPEPA